MHVTGKIVVKPRSIKVNFTDSDGQSAAAISAHTCSNEITFPRDFIENDTAESYELFSSALEAVMCGVSFNIV